MNSNKELSLTMARNLLLRKSQMNTLGFTVSGGLLMMTRKRLRLPRIRENHSR